MTDAETYRYALPTGIPVADLEDTLALAVLACQALHGETQVRLDAAYDFDRRQRTCAIDAGTIVGRDLNRLFAGLLAREFGPTAFAVGRGEPDRLPTRRGRGPKPAAA
jgi:hypothetical protein